MQNTERLSQPRSRRSALRLFRRSGGRRSARQGEACFESGCQESPTGASFFGAVLPHRGRRTPRELFVKATPEGLDRLTSSSSTISPTA